MHRPDWYDRPPNEWPTSARIAYSILLRAAVRRVEREGSGEPLLSVEVGTRRGRRPSSGDAAV